MTTLMTYREFGWGSRQFVLFNSLHIFKFLQFQSLRFVRDQLCISSISADVQPLPSETSGAEWQQCAGCRSETSVWVSGASLLYTGETEVRHHILVVAEMNMWQLQIWLLYWPHWVFTVKSVVFSDFHPIVDTSQSSSCKIVSWFVILIHKNCTGWNIQR